MDIIDLDNLTGTESLEELEAALNALENGDDAEIQDDDAQATVTEGTGVETVPPTAEVNSSTQPADVQEGEQEATKVILSKDGKHQIPYDVLEAERVQRQTLAEENAQLKALVAERERLQQVLERHGIDPLADPDALNVAEIEQLTQDYPELGTVLTGIAKRVEALSQRATPVPQPQMESAPPVEVQTALQAVPELAVWMAQDQDRAIFAVNVDERLKNDPVWKDKSLTERFAEVAKRTKAAFGDPVEQQAPPASKSERNTVEERDHIPQSPSDLGQSVQHASTLEKFSAMSQEQLMAEMSNMSADQIEALLAEHDL
ncbi:hypothetical protein [Aeromonas enterica]